MSYFHLGAGADLLEAPTAPAPAGVADGRIRIVELDRLCHDATVSKAAFRAGNLLIESGWIQWPAPCWDEPVIAAMDGDECVAGINWSKDEKQLYAAVEFAFCDNKRPQALAMCLLRARKRADEAGLKEIRFAHHSGNEPMEKLVRRLRLKPHSLSFRVPVRRAA